MHLPACGKCRCWLSCCLAAFAAWCFSFQLRLCLFGGWSDCYWQIQVMGLIRHSRQVQFTGSSLSFGSESPLGSSSFRSGPVYTSSVNLTSVPQLIVCAGAGCWDGRQGRGSTVVYHGGDWVRLCCSEARSDVERRCRPVSHTARWVSSTRQCWTILLSEIETSVVAGCPCATWCPCCAGLGLPFWSVHPLGLAASMLETGSSVKFYFLSRCFCQGEKY